MRKRASLFFVLSLLLAIAARAQYPQITSLNPASVTVGSGDQTLAVFGTNFLNGATINFNGQALTTTFVASNQLTATVTAAHLAAASAAYITVTQSGSTTNQFPFQVLTPIANVQSWNPTFFTPGQSVTVDVFGQGFLASATVLFDWQTVSTTFFDQGHISGAVQGSQISGSGPHYITVYNGAVPSGEPSLITPTGVMNFSSVTSGGNFQIEFSIYNRSATVVTLATPYFTITGPNSSDFTNLGTGSCHNNTAIASLTACTVDLQFAPSVLGGEVAVMTLASNGIGSPQSFSLSGIGIPVAAPATSFSPSSLSFGSQLQSTASSTVTSTLTNSGTSSLTLSALSATGTNSADFALSGTCTSSIVLTPGASCTLDVVFTPSTTSTESAAISITDDATGSPQFVPLAGIGISTAAHNVVVTWSASTSQSLIGYNVYRATTNGGPYTLLTPTPVSGLSYTDFQVTHLTQYFYVVTAVGTNPPYSTVESAISSQASATP